MLPLILMRYKERELQSKEKYTVYAHEKKWDTKEKKKKEEAEEEEMWLEANASLFSRDVT